MWEIRQHHAILDMDGQIMDDEMVDGISPADMFIKGWEPFSVETVLHVRNMVKIWYRRKD
jgi:hypothetical protein